MTNATAETANERREDILAVSPVGIRAPPLPHAAWCRRCKTLARLESLGYTEPERPSDKEFREASERGEVFLVIP